METSLMEGGEVAVGFDVVEGSHVYAKREDGADAFLDWDELPASLRDACREDAARLKEAFRACRGTMAAILNFYRNAEPRDRIGSAAVSV